jgi:hypothetical protein
VQAAKAGDRRRVEGGGGGVEGGGKNELAAPPTSNSWRGDGKAIDFFCHFFKSSTRAVKMITKREREEETGPPRPSAVGPVGPAAPILKKGKLFLFFFVLLFSHLVCTGKKLEFEVSERRSVCLLGI